MGLAQHLAVPVALTMDAGTGAGVRVAVADAVAFAPDDAEPVAEARVTVAFGCRPIPPEQL
eukprot:COSAG04_NODE_32397_length_251_cov_0.684211_1_plen_60_part_01